MQLLFLVLSVLFLQPCNSKVDGQVSKNQKMNIIHAVEKGKTEQVEQELKNGANVNTADENGRSLLLIATRNNDLQTAELLVKHGADVNQQDNIMDSPFLYAGAVGHLQLVKLYLANGARFDVFNRYNGSALIPACERGHVEVVRLLANTKGFPIDHINRLGWTGLLEAVILGDGSEPYRQIVRILIDAGTNVTIADKDGLTPLQHARSRGFTQIAGTLEKASKNKPGM